MRAERIEVFRANAGWKTHSFMKVGSETGVIGWGEVSHDFGAGRALKCNLLLRGWGEPRRFKAERAERLDDNTVESVAHELESTLAAFREGAGSDVELLVDIGGGFPAHAATVLARAAARHDVRLV